jgi:hypothetical protein
MELISEEIENYLDRIAAASKIVDVDDKVLLFRQPTIDNKMESRRIYEFEYKKSYERFNKRKAFNY